MRTLSFHRSLYSAEAIEATMELFADHARCELTIEEPYSMLRLEPAEELDDEITEEQLAGEFSNHVLARTIEQKRSGR